LLWPRTPSRHANCKDTFLLSLELTRQSYGFDGLGFVVKPGTFTFSYSEPPNHETSFATAIQALKLPDMGHPKHPEL
jgi:hypothetical protein